MMMKLYCHYLIYKYKFTFSLFYTMYKLKNDKNGFDFQGNVHF